MKATEANLMEFIKKCDQFIIPIYQRNYNWTFREVDQLMRDIQRVGRSQDSITHFIGAIVYITEGITPVTDFKPVLLIDGQQRIATIMLLLSAIRDYIKKNNIEGINVPVDKINAYYLINEKEIGDKKYKLILNKDDKENLFKIIDGNIDLEINYKNRLAKNYIFIFNKLNNNNLENYYNGLFKLLIIDVSLEKDKDNPQLIFESLNSTGLELTQSDLIRNYILMGLEKSLQDEIYFKYWYPIESLFKNDSNTKEESQNRKFDRFFRDYLTIKTNKIPNFYEIYQSFKDFAENKKYNIKGFVEEIYYYAKIFSKIASKREEDKDLYEIFEDIEELKVEVSYPFIMQVYKDYKENKIDKDVLIEILKLIESYVFRRSICGIPPNSLNKTFATLYREIDKNNYLESFKIALIRKKTYRRFPTDEEFKNHFIYKDVYNFRNRDYLFRKLENYGKKEKICIKNYTIEHILPQNENLSIEWQKELGENWKEIQKKYLHTIGNITLTGYNPELSDRPFKEKRDMVGGFKESPLRLNQYLAKIETWNENEILKRAEILAEIALKIWHYPKIKDKII